MGITAETIDKKRNDFSKLTEKTYNAGLLFSSFVSLEKKHCSHLTSQQCPKFISWVKRQQVKYYNLFIVNYAVDMGLGEPTTTRKLPDTFRSLKNYVWKDEQS